MLADPLTLTADWTTLTADAGENTVFTASERASDHSTYKFVDQDSTGKTVTWTLFNGHQYGRRNRFTSRLTVDSLMPDLLVPANNSKFSQSVYVVADLPQSGSFEPYGGTPPNLETICAMMHLIGGLLISVDTADPLFRRIINGET